MTPTSQASLLFLATSYRLPSSSRLACLPILMIHDSILPRPGPFHKTKFVELAVSADLAWAWPGADYRATTTSSSRVWSFTSTSKSSMTP
ncbi:hypothetical protein M440DRAFT_1140332 [Trichoderma longibrachiatum ATCC 18648]|uniref:Uncharacterized protein n=1 Tax=Trichoderma longibrachiatum ATCC 18648 TaxID=983965 RepID=A0A2T4BR14_TRILO|nr:hypothetical protein M440DRAFT_1140332 [Trichoderma longibrachiatum ATCC 18648]